MGPEIKSSPGNGPYLSRIYGQIYHLVSALYPSKANRPGCGQLYIADSAEAKTKQLENQSNQGSMVETKQQLNERLLQVNPFPEFHTRTQQKKRNA
jgi:hypothetical protein